MDITWTLKDSDAQVILSVLGKLPYEQVVKLIDSLREQIATQQKMASEQLGKK